MRNCGETFGFLLFPGTEELDLVGPWELIRKWSEDFGGPKQCLLLSEEGKPVRCARGMTIHADASFQEAPELDFLLIPGGRGTREQVDNPVLIDFVRRQARVCRHVLSVCTGSFILHRAGLLTGKRATTYWGSLDRLRALGDVAVVEERYVRAGNVWTSAGVSAGLDLALALIAEVGGPRAAGEVQLAAEYYPSTIRFGDAHRRPEAPGYLQE